jgi:adenylate cyclase
LRRAKARRTIGAMGENRWPWIDKCFGACVITDAGHYTAIAERIDAAKAVDLVNCYLEVLFKPVFVNGGAVSDVKGDGMLAVWTEPAPSAELRSRVCRACLQMAEGAERFARSLPGFTTRIGASYGPLALAAIGTPEHHEYRAVGDTVNTASRLEALNKALGTRVLVSASLAEGLPGLRVRDLGKVRLPGKANRVGVLELLGYESLTSTGSCPSSKRTVIQGTPARWCTSTVAKLAHAAIGLVT